jgi:hypothetical protein
MVGPKAPECYVISIFSVLELVMKEWIYATVNTQAALQFNIPYGLHITTQIVHLSTSGVHHICHKPARDVFHSAWKYHQCRHMTLT